MTARGRPYRDPSRPRLLGGIPCWEWGYVIPTLDFRPGDAEHTWIIRAIGSNGRIFLQTVRIEDIPGWFLLWEDNPEQTFEDLFGVPPPGPPTGHPWERHRARMVERGPEHSSPPLLAPDDDDGEGF